MAITSTIAAARVALVTQLDTGMLAGKVHYAWPGPNAAQQHELVWVDQVPQWTQEIPNIKAGRKQRQESYSFELVVWVANQHLTSDGAQETFERAVELAGVIESALADDVQLGETDVQWMQVTDRSVDLVPMKSGWGCQIVLTVEAEARLF